MARRRPEVLVLVALVGVVPLFPNHMPPALYGLGVVNGAGVALQALGVVLVYRSNRIINFAQVQVGALAATLFASLVQFRPLLRGLVAVCPRCGATSALTEVNYWLSLALSAAAAVGAGYAIHLLVIKRFTAAPRLAVTVATIFLAQFLAGVRSALPTLLSTERQRLAGAALSPARLPFSWTLRWSPVRFDTAQLLMVTAAGAAVVGLGAYLASTRSGVAVRAAADDPARAAALGIDVDRLNGRVWAAAGALSGAAALVAATSAAPSGPATLDVHATVVILAVALVAGLESLPVVAAAAAALGVLSTAVVWSYGSSVMLDAVVLGVILVVLLLSRATDASPPRDHASGWRPARPARPARPVPSGLAALGAVRAWRYAGTVLVAAAAVGFPWLMAPSAVNLGALVLIYALVVVSLAVLSGWAGQISLGQFGLAAVGAYVAAMAPHPFPLALVLGAGAGAATGVLVGLPALRLRGLELAVATLAFAATVPSILLSRNYLGRRLPDSLGRPAFLGINFLDERSFYYLSLVVLAVAVVGVVGLRHSRFARALIAGRDNPPGARSFGVNVGRDRLAAFAVSGGLAGLAGALFAFHQRGVTPSAFAPEVSLTLFVTAVIGGLGSLAGPFLGSLYLGALTLGSAAPVVIFMLTGGGGLLFVLAVPGGLAELAARVRDSGLRTLAARHGIAVPAMTGSRRSTTTAYSAAPIVAVRRPQLAQRPATYELADRWAPEDTDRRPARATAP